MARPFLPVKLGSVQEMPLLSIILALLLIMTMFSVKPSLMPLMGLDPGQAKETECVIALWQEHLLQQAIFMLAKLPKQLNKILGLYVEMILTARVNSQQEIQTLSVPAHSLTRMETHTVEGLQETLIGSKPQLIKHGDNISIINPPLIAVILMKSGTNLHKLIKHNVIFLYLPLQTLHLIVLKATVMILLDILLQLHAQLLLVTGKIL